MFWQYCYFLQSKHRILSLCLPLLSEVDLVFYQGSTSGSMLLCFSPGWRLIVDAASRCPWSPAGPQFLWPAARWWSAPEDLLPEISPFDLTTSNRDSKCSVTLLGSLPPFYQYSNSEWILGVSWFGRWQLDSQNICRQFAEDVHETMTQHLSCLS